VAADADRVRVPSDTDSVGVPADSVSVRLGERVGVKSDTESVTAPVCVRCEPLPVRVNEKLMDVLRTGGESDRENEAVWDERLCVSVSGPSVPDIVADRFSVVDRVGIGG
jgi:hypothetical protein